MEGHKKSFKTRDSFVKKLGKKTISKKILLPKSFNRKNDASNPQFNSKMQQVLHTQGTPINEALLKSVLKKNPSAARASYADNMENEEYLPIFIVINRRNATFDMVNDLLKANPHAAKTRCPKRNETLLHCACRNSSSLEVVSLLHKERPNAVKVKDSNGNTPLHAACIGGASIEVISFLLDKWPNAVEEKSIDGTTPLHLACVGAPLEVVSLLLEKCPEAVKIQNNGGATPLHYTCTSPEKTKLLLKHWPEAAAVTDIKGDTPLHFVCGGDISLGVMLLLLEHTPESVFQRNKDKMTPFDCGFGNYPDDEDGMGFGGYARYDGLDKQKMVLVAVQQVLTFDMYDKTDEHQSAALRFIKNFMDIEWLGGVALVLDHSPLVIFKSFVHVAPTYIFPEVISKMGNQCRMLTLWFLLRGKQDILKF